MFCKGWFTSTPSSPQCQFSPAHSGSTCRIFRLYLDFVKYMCPCFCSVFSLYFLLTVFHVIVISSHCSFLCCIFIPLYFILLYLHLVVFSTSWFLHLLSFYPTVFSSHCIFILPPVPFSTLFGSKMSFPVSHNPLPVQLSLFLICIVLFKCATTLPIRWILCVLLSKKK